MVKMAPPMMQEAKSDVLKMERDDECLRVYTMEEVSEHKVRGDCWTVIGDYVYDISSFVDVHPGGDLILQCLGRDSSVLFLSSHPLYVKRNMLPKYKIGKIQRPSSEFGYEWESSFYDTMRGRVEAYFQKHGLKRQDSVEMYVTIAATLVLYMVCYYFAYLQGYFLAAIPCGFFLSQLGINIMHDGNHGATSRNPKVCFAAGMVMDLLGGSSLTWKHQHNIGHHQYTNSVGMDPDCSTAYPLIRFNPTQPFRWYHAYQQYYVFFLYGMHALKWYFADMINVYLGHYRTVEMYPPTRYELLQIVVCKTVAFLMHFLVPLVLLGPIRFIFMFFTVLCTTSYCFSFQFVVNHLVDDAVFPEVEGKEKDWAKLQVMTSCDYAPGSHLWNVISGGLNHQIEHHLFPTFSHVHYPKHIQPIVEETCKEFGVKYPKFPTLWDSLKNHYRHMANMGTDPASLAQ